MLIAVYTDQGKVRALIRAALNERALERYILSWLSDTNGLLQRYESWALFRDNEASNLLPSIAAGENWEPSNCLDVENLVRIEKYDLHISIGLGSILFAVTVDSPELNIVAPVETKSLQKPNEIIIAVPVVGASSDIQSQNESKSMGSKRKQIISFEDDEMESVSSHSSNSIRFPTMSLSDACLKYEVKEKQRIETIQAICNDSSYQRLMDLTATPQCSENTATSIETEYIEPESPTKIKLYSPVLSAKTYPTTLSKEFESAVSTPPQSSNVASTTTTASSSSAAAQQLPLHTSLSESMTGSISSVNQSAHAVAECSSATSARLQELEQRCASLEEQITTMTLWETDSDVEIHDVKIMIICFVFPVKMLDSNRCTTI